jgi:hypothetical protein
MSSLIKKKKWYLLLRKDECELGFHAHPLCKMFSQQIYKEENQIAKTKTVKQ